MVAVRLRLAAGLAAATLVPSLSSALPGDEDHFFRAYYLQHEHNDLEGAHKLYLEVANDRSVSSELRQKAKQAAEALGEDLASADFTRLIPRDALFYAQLSRPGEQLSMLLSQLGLLGRVQDSEGFGVSPLLVDGMLGMRGAAVAVTSMSQDGMPSGVVLLHPGDLDVVRGLIETALPAAGQPVEAIGGFPTWSIEGEALVTLTNRLVIASTERREIDGVIARMGGAKGDSLADNDALKGVLERSGDGLLSFCVNAEPLMPMIEGMLAEQAGNDPEVAMMMAFLDVRSLRSVSGHVGVDEDGVNVEVAVELAEGHRNLAFNLMRMPQVERDTLAQVPSGAAFFASLGLNPEGAVAPITRDSAGQPVVSFFDFGREFFGNLVDLTVYGLPSDGHSPLPDLALLLRVNDVERSHALWSFALGAAGGATGGSMGPSQAKIAGHSVDQYSLGGMPLYLAAGEGRIVLSPSRKAVERALLASKPKQSIFDDPVFSADVQRIDEGHTIVAMANPGRCIEFAAGMMDPDDMDEEMAMIADLLADTVVTVGMEHTDTRLGFRARVSNIPDVSGLVVQAIRGERDHDAFGYAGRGNGKVFAMNELAPAPAEAGQSLMSLRSDFDRLASEGHHHQAHAVGQQVFEAAFEDPYYLNNMAWTIATEKPYAGHYLELAMSMSERSNELTEFGNWYYVDTLALLMFEIGEVKEAVKLARRAVELAGDDPRGSEARDALKRYEEALEPVTTAAATSGR
ncbi:MAG: hypothetical protein AAF682_05010 [Planctomycetota bacterium]